MKRIALFLLFTSLAWAGFPPTSTKFSSDSNPVTTFELDFPNFTVTHAGVRATAGTLAIGGGGTGLASMTAHSVLLGSTTSVQQTISSTVGAPLISQGSSSDPLFGALDLSNASIINNSLSVSHGGTGLASDTAYALLAGGTTSTGALQQVSGVGSSGQVLTSNGASALPTWQAASPTFSGLTQFGVIYAGNTTSVLSTAAGTSGQPLLSNATSAPTYGAIALGSTTAVSGTLPVSNGGNGVPSLTAYSLIAGGTTTTAAVQQVAAGASTGQVLTYQGSSALPVWASLSGNYIASWSGYQTNSGGCSVTTGTLQDPSACTGMAVTEQTNTNMGTVTTAGSSLPGLTLTFPITGTYLIQANVSTKTSSTSSDNSIQMTDGSTVFSQPVGASSGPGANDVGGVFISGLYGATGGVSKTIKLQIGTDAGTFSITNALNGKAITWNITLVSGGSNVSSGGTGGFHVESAAIAQSGATSWSGATACGTSATCGTFNASTAGWISFVNDGSTGNYTGTIAAGTFSTYPNCTCSWDGNGADTYCELDLAGRTVTATSIHVHASANGGFSIICMGPR